MIVFLFFSCSKFKEKQTLTGEDLINFAKEVEVEPSQLRGRFARDRAKLKVSSIYVFI